MSSRILTILKIYWPMVLLAVPFALVYAALLYFFTEAIEIQDSLSSTDPLGDAGRLPRGAALASTNHGILG